MTDLISNLPEEQHPIWVAVGDFSHTDKRKLWRVLTRRTTKISAETYASLANEDELSKPQSRRRHHFVVKLTDPSDY